MARAYVYSHTIAAANPGTTLTTTPINAPAGAAVWVWVSEGNIGATLISSVGDSTGSSFALKKQVQTGPPTSLYVADGVAGSGAYTVTVDVSSSERYVVEVMVIAGQTTPSFDKAGTGANVSSYTSGTTESDALSPSQGSNLLLFAMAGHSTASSGISGNTYGAEAGETLVDSDQAGNGTTLIQSLGVYSVPASGTGSQSPSGNYAFGGTAASSNATYFSASVNSAPSGATLLLLSVGLVLSRLRDALRAAPRPAPRPLVTA
jgi:hypothetical protein